MLHERLSHIRFKKYGCCLCCADLLLDDENLFDKKAVSTSTLSGLATLVDMCALPFLIHLRVYVSTCAVVSGCVRVLVSLNARTFPLDG